METIKEEKKADLEQLLNSLIEKGWKPRWNQPEESLKKKLKVERYNRKPVAIVIKRPRRFIDEYYSFRELVSKESWLWQFVCENGMVDKQHWYIEELKWWKADDDEEWHDNWEERYSTEYQFWLIESSLKDESELEDFLLNSIKVD